jgi:hypothetical protein
MPHEVFAAKSRLLAEALGAFPFRQCIVFSNYRDRAEMLAETLADQGWACAPICGRQDPVRPFGNQCNGRILVLEKSFVRLVCFFTPSVL